LTRQKTWLSPRREIFPENCFSSWPVRRTRKRSFPMFGSPIRPVAWSFELVALDSFASGRLKA
jgi:hypothetical protein